ncbi:MAG TPA: tRNA-uridine aminocarboxypropyltransferase [Oxalicibacterium sp.]|nr:tRNA-uridine aminocarboxypropyltransferase [Oxalicibacterium sp.]
MQAPKRPYCPRCQRPQASCICRWIARVAIRTEVLILQHPMEVRQAKGSARLLQLSLPNSRLYVGESFERDLLRESLFEPFPPDRPDCMIRPVLLYPDDGNSTAPLWEPEKAGVSGLLRHRLVVLDGTWRKSLRMLHANPMLQKLPRLVLREPPPSIYRIRKAHRPEQLSTFEATCQALLQMGESATQIDALLAAFAGFVEQQQSYMDRGSRDTD